MRFTKNLSFAIGFLIFYSDLSLSLGIGDCKNLETDGKNKETAENYVDAASLYYQASECYAAAGEALQFSSNKKAIVANYEKNGLPNKMESQLIVIRNNETRLKNNAEKSNGKSNFLGLSLGYGFAAVMYDHDIVHEASVVNGVIVAESVKENEAKIVLEFHQIIWGKDKANKGFGPFAALMVAENDILNGIGVGLLYSIRNKVKNDSGFSIGAGWMLENKVKQLADGFEVGEALPSGEPTVRFVEKDEIAPFIFISNTF